MSNWNKDEVDALRADMGGGNARNSATTFAHLPNESALWPKKGCHPNELKEFIVAAYNDRKWFGEAAPVEAPQPPRPKAPPSVSKTVSLPNPNPADFFSASTESDGWAAFSGAPNNPAPTHEAALAAQPAAACAAGWANFSAAPAAPVTGEDTWEPFSASPAAHTAPPAFAADFNDFVAAAPVAVPVTANSPYATVRRCPTAPASMLSDSMAALSTGSPLADGNIKQPAEVVGPRVAKDDILKLFG
uniref:Arf-GAP domain-containing protein n=3 Tax=Chrysotila carterae TaxID=13221 RepID=A0A6S9SXI1_CHRCT